MLRRAAELGVDHIDTAHFYGAGLANELIRAALSPYPDGLVLVTKAGATRTARAGCARRSDPGSCVPESSQTCAAWAPTAWTWSTCAGWTRRLGSRPRAISSWTSTAFPLGSGFPGRAKVAEHPAVVAAATTLGCTPAQVALAWLLHHDPHTLLIPGTASTAHLEENMAVSRVHLDPATAATLDALAAV